MQHVRQQHGLGVLKPSFRAEDYGIARIHVTIALPIIIGFALLAVGRPGGPVPTIAVELTDMSYQFVLLAMLLGTVALPSFSTTVMGEDLNATWR